MIIRIDPDVEHFKSILPAVSRQEILRYSDTLQGEKRAGIDFAIPAVYISQRAIDRRLPTADFMRLAPSIAISERACAALRQFILPENQLIPLRGELEGYHGLNPLLTANGADLLRIMIYQRPSPGPIIGAILPRAITTGRLFQISNIEGLFGPASFRDAYVTAGFTGLVFTETAMVESCRCPDTHWMEQLEQAERRDEGRRHER